MSSGNKQKNGQPLHGLEWAITSCKRHLDWPQMPPIDAFFSADTHRLSGVISWLAFSVQPVIATKVLCLPVEGITFAWFQSNFMDY